MLRTVYTPDSNCINVAIPDRYIGTELEIQVFPINEIFSLKKRTPDIDTSFGGWADMDKTTEEICSEIRAGRNFRNRDLAL
jgi:hypothetical protein